MNKKGQDILVYKTLEKYSDQDHYLTQKQIADYIEQDYGVRYERKSIKTACEVLVELNYGLDFGAQKGVALVDRLFKPGEVTYLVDAIFSSRVIPSNESEDLAKRITNTLSEPYRNNYKYLYKVQDITKTQNNEIFANIDIIRAAIKNHRKVAFKYLTYDINGKEVYKNNGMEYIVSPYQLVNSQGRYYLLCRYIGKDDKYSSKEDLATFRLDYMKEMRKTTEVWDEITSIKKYKYGLDIAQYTNDRIYMFGGEVITARLKLKNPDVVRYVKDWFGNNAVIERVGNDLIARVKCCEPALYFWCLQYSSNITVLGPEELITQIKKNAEETMKKYA